MASIVRVDEKELPWADFDAYAPGQVRYKTISPRGGSAPPMQYVEYAPGHEDGMHSHEEGEVFVITAGEVVLGDTVNGPGSVVYIPRDTEYALRCGEAGVRFFRIVVP
jgi:quercetin dioxygenase-like cupin family protein